MRLAPDCADWTALAALHSDAFRGEAALPWSAAALESAARAPGAALFVRPWPAPRAFALARVAAGEAELLTLAVAPAERRRGCARALLAELRADARREGAEAIFLEVATTNAAARALYAQAGFAQVGLRRGYHGAPGAAPTDAAILRLDLGNPPVNSA